MTNALQTHTNRLQTAANNGQQTTNWRKRGMVSLAALTAITLVGQYVMLGTAGLGRDLSDLPTWFFIAEKTLWGLRGLVEIAVVVYVGMTVTADPRQERTLWRFKLALIALIVLTVGPVWIASTLNQSVPVTISVWGVYVWGAALAGISATMLAAVAYAYKVQPVDDGLTIVTNAAYADMLAAVGAAEGHAAKLLADVAEAVAARQQAEAGRDLAMAEASGLRESVTFFKHLPGTAQVQIIAMFAQGRPDTESLAQAFNLSESTVRGVLAKVSK